jgi:hypothetical protein
MEAEFCGVAGNEDRLGWIEYAMRALTHAIVGGKYARPSDG